jgi:hypothetical protein
VSQAAHTQPAAHVVLIAMTHCVQHKVSLSVGVNCRQGLNSLAYGICHMVHPLHCSAAHSANLDSLIHLPLSKPRDYTLLCCYHLPCR